MKDAMMEHMDLLLAHATGKKAISNAQAVKVERCHTWFIMPDHFTESKEVEFFDQRIRLVSDDGNETISLKLMTQHQGTCDFAFKSRVYNRSLESLSKSYSKWFIWHTRVAKSESFPESQKEPPRRKRKMTQNSRARKKQFPDFAPPIQENSRVLRGRQQADQYVRKSVK
eukprot:g16212.t1